jgi:queuine tRNA-ribosyltransferase
LCCARFSRAYLRHLFQCQEILYSRLASLHNLTYYIRLVDGARRAIIDGRLASYRAEIEAGWATSEGDVAAQSG